MRFAVESWAPEYGSPADAGELTPSEARVDPGVEVPAADWAGQRPATAPATEVRFVDGIRRIDARLWIDDTAGAARQALAASLAAGIACCDRTARIETTAVRRVLVGSAQDLSAVATRLGTYQPAPAAGDTADELVAAVGQRMGALEAEVAGAGHDGLLVVDGPLSKLATPGRAVGFVKTHQRSYLPDDLAGVVAQLGAGERTPLFLTTSTWSRFAWYTRLPGPAAHPWAGVVRGEVSGDLPPAEAAALADVATVTWPRFASAAHKDPRAPANLYPIGELERCLRARLGEAALLYRALRAAAVGA